jgi:hypothetical protein
MRTFLPTLSSLVISALFVAACSSSDTGSPSGGTSSGGPAPGPGTGPDPTPTCAPVTGPGVTHSGDIEGEATWTAAGSPHVVIGNVNVRSGAKLTVEPCAEVRVAAGMGIRVAHPITPNTGTLVAEGTPTQPIRIVGLDGARWASVAVQAPGTERFAHVTFENGGGGDFQHEATLVAYGDSEDGADPIVSVDHVTIAKSLGAGAWLSRGAAFAAGSNALRSATPAARARRTRSRSRSTRSIRSRPGRTRAIARTRSCSTLPAVVSPARACSPTRRSTTAACRTTSARRTETASSSEVAPTASS